MQNTKDKILKTATELFADKGFKQTTVRDICNVAKVNVASVNYHFKGKQDLFESVLEKMFEKKSQRHKEIIKNRKVTNEKEWRQVFIDFIYEFISDHGRKDDIDRHRTKMFFRELGNPSEFFQRMHQKYFSPIDESLKKYIRMGLPENAPEEEVSLWLITIISQCGFFKRKHHIPKVIHNIDFRDPEKIKMVADHIAKTIFANLKYRGGKRS